MSCIKQLYFTLFWIQKVLLSLTVKFGLTVCTALEVKLVWGHIKDCFTERGSHANRLDNFTLNYGYPTGLTFLKSIGRCQRPIWTPLR